MSVFIVRAGKWRNRTILYLLRSSFWTKFDRKAKTAGSSMEGAFTHLRRKFSQEKPIALRMLCVCVWSFAFSRPEKLITKRLSHYTPCNIRALGNISFAYKS